MCDYPFSLTLYYILNLGLLLKSFTHFRLLVLCLLDNKGVSQIVAEFTHSNKQGNDVLNPDKTIVVSRVAQLLASVPDKARLGASAALRSTYPFPLWNSLLFIRQLTWDSFLLNFFYVVYCAQVKDNSSKIGFLCFFIFISAVCCSQSQIIFVLSICS
jgi:hypothetical protein